jgi:hypothetical protein
LAEVEKVLEANKARQRTFSDGESQVQRAGEEAVKSLESLRCRRPAPLLSWSYLLDSEY